MSQNRTDYMETGMEEGACESKNEDPIAGLIGPGSSSVTIQIQNLLSLFHIPQIGYSATSKDLSDKSLYEYFLRVVPSDKLQARALIDIVLHYNWTYISTVYTEGNYGASGMEEFKEMMDEEGICEAITDHVVNDENNEAHDVVIENLLREPKARVVVCFCEGLTIRRLLDAAKRQKKEGHFLFLGSDGWNVRLDVVKGREDLAAGGFSMKLHSPPVAGFRKYFSALRPSTNLRNPWFTEFWEEKFNCTLRSDQLQGKRRCTEKEDVMEGFRADAKLGFVVNAIYTMAHALHNMLEDVCGLDRGGLCKAMIPVNGTLFLDYLFNASFMSYSGDEINFDEFGDPPAIYDIMNYRPVKKENGTMIYDYVKIGGWNNYVLTLQDDVFWPTKNKETLLSPNEVESVCSHPCPWNQIKVIGGMPCCWGCKPCEYNEYIVDELTCVKCEDGWLPNDNLTGCYQIPIEYMQWDDTEAVVAMVLSCLGVFATGWTSLVFIRHNDTPVVKASTRELSYIILVGIALCYLTSFPLVAKPSLITCYLARILPGFAFSLIYGALVTKTNRIARILAGSKKKIMTRKPRFMTSSAQLVITFIIIGIEVAIIVVMLIFEPADFKFVYPTKTRVRLTCNATTKGIIVPLGFIGFLIAMCTLYAVKTRNVPENFNEAKFIGFTMYTTCIIWLAFVGIYFGSDNKVITMCMAITLSATVALILLFFPKIYIIVCKPEKNNRSAFTTSKEVRCHIGSTTRYSSSGPSVYQWKVDHTPSGHKIVACDKEIWNEQSFENAAMTIYRQKSVFDRWRRKSSPMKSGETESSHSPAYSQVATSAPAMPPSRDVENGILDVEEMTPTKGKVIRRIKAPAPFKDFEMEFDEMDAMIEERESLIIQTPQVRTADSAVQTSQELLQDMLVGLRRRKVKCGLDDRTQYGEYSDKVSLNNSRSTSASTGSESFPSDNYLAIRNNHYRSADKNLNCDATESNHLCPNKYALSSSQHSDNSPLLSSSRELFEYDSTSEETLSELAEPMHDLDTLLMEVAPHTGSFGSLKEAGSLSCTPSDSTVVDCNDRIIESKQCKGTNKKQSHQDAIKPHRKLTKNSPTHTRSKSAHPYIEHVKPCLTPRLSFNDSGYKAHSPVHAKTALGSNIIIPRINIERASLSSSDVSADSGRQSDRVYDADSRRTSFLSGPADRTSAELSSIEDLTMSDMSDAPVFYSSSKNQKPNKTDSVTEFKDYLRTKGLKLDLNSVQSSEV